MSALQLGYCTNVHAGADLATTRANLEQHALGVKRRFSPEAPMGVGLWLSARAAREMLATNQAGVWRDWLAKVGLVPFTFNGFPYGDFHQRVVKHDVYRPTWLEPARLEYTRDLVTIIDLVLPPGLEGSISTLPIAWGDPPLTAAEKDKSGENLRRAAQFMAATEAKTGRLVYLCLEPEPGCVLQRSEDIVRFFQDHILRGHDQAPLRRHLRICHDICHQAVMFENQAEVFTRYRGAGIAVGKVQVSAAVAVRLDRLPAGEHAAAVDQLAGFAEDRYLHQTVVRADSAAEPVFYEDLPAAIHTGTRAGEWRVHFHVPIYLNRFGRLETTQWAIRDCLRSTMAHGDTTHFEVETYAWGVLPPELRQPDLASGIAREMEWCRSAMQSL